MTVRRALVITPKITFHGTGYGHTPEDYAAHGLGSLLNRLAPVFRGEGTVLVDREAAEALALPTSAEDFHEAMDAHPCAEEARARGWKVGRIGQWTTFYGDNRPALHLGISPLIPHTEKAFPLGCEWPGDTAAALDRWHEVTGYAWNGTPGTAGLEILSGMHPKGKGRVNPTWKPGNAGPSAGVEDDYHPDQWHAPRSGMEYAHGYDSHRAYVGAGMSVKVCPWELRNRGRHPFDPREGLAGWWEVDLAPWQLPHMPDPAGYDPSGQGRRIRWITTPTMLLLHQLTEEGVYGGVRILDSYTGPGKDIFRDPCTRLREAFDTTAHGRDEVVDTAVNKAVKEAGRQMFGLLGRASNWAYRPDWWYSIIAQYRVNLWRKAWTIGRTEERWPLWIDVDNIWYGSDIGDPRQACPRGLPLTPEGAPGALGYFKPKASKRNRRKAS